ncbi:alpha/beta fold hydrolase [uncultured Lacinutrix sp.]|uniref:alpha/beta fold hydrolase n=1 Tax=uncultured Lacinutrix sp. TaxID=574032 RepID=UPI0026393B0F|nr:alpha/beta fold hydrolase [uncultured Lacinutrix sp.]
MKKNNLLLLHGALGSKVQLESIKSLLSNNYNVYSIDFEGHGSEASNNKFSIALFTKNVLDTLSKLNIIKINIFGYSMGGYVALNFALQNPEMVDNIVTLGTKFNWSKDSAEREVKMLNPNVIEEKVPKFANRLNELHRANNWKHVVNKTADMMIQLADKEKLNNDDFKQIKHSVLIGIGTLDAMVTIEESEKIATILDNGNLKIIENFQHPIEKIDPKQLSNIILDFIK